MAFIAIALKLYKMINDIQNIILDLCVKFSKKKKNPIISKRCAVATKKFANFEQQKLLIF